MTLGVKGARGGFEGESAVIAGAPPHTSARPSDCGSNRIYRSCHDDAPRAATRCPTPLASCHEILPHSGERGEPPDTKKPRTPVFHVMRRRGLEPPPTKCGPGPQPGASTNSAIGARHRAVYAGHVPGRPSAREVGRPASLDDALQEPGVRSSRAPEDLRRGGPCSRIAPSSGSRRGRRSPGRSPSRAVAISIVMPSVAELADDVEHLGDELGIERARDLVEQHQSGCIASARTIATRCCWPPDSRSGYSSALVGEADARRGARQRARSASASSSSSTLRGASVMLREHASCAGTGCRPGTRCRSRRRMRLMSTPRAVISSPVDHDPPRVDRLEQVHAPQQRRLAEPDAPMRQTTSCSSTTRSMPRSTSSVTEATCARRSISQRLAGAVVSPSLGACAAAVARDQPVDEARHRDRDHARKHHARPRGRA